MGYRHIDCAWIYDNEAEIGKAFQDAFDAGDVTRRAVCYFKTLNCFHLAEDVEPAIKESLEALKLDYLDLYLIHWPIAHRPGVKFSPDNSGFAPIEDYPIANTWQAMERLVEMGLTKHIGVSNFNVVKLKDLIDKCNIVPEMNQVESHPLLAQNELFNFCSDHGILYTAYSPLGSRDRAEALKGQDEPDMFENAVLKGIAEKHSVDPAQILIKWAERRGTAVIPKSVNPARLKAHLDSANIPLSKQDMEAINALDKGYRFLNGKFWEREGGYYTADGLWNN